MKILDRLPIHVEPTLIDARGDSVQVWRNQIIVWLSLLEGEPPFPAILDTGHSHNLSIAHRHLVRWGRIDPPKIGEARVSGRVVPLHETPLWIHRNRRQTRELTALHRLEMPGGIAVIPDDLPIAPRLPLLGIKAILGNRLRLMIDGERRVVTLEAVRRGWFSA